jgi:hypothetical protein
VNASSHYRLLTISPEMLSSTFLDEEGRPSFQRGNPLTDDFIKAIRLIAKPGCVFTYSGSPAFAAKAKTTLSGTVLEERPDGRIVIQL